MVGGFALGSQDDEMDLTEGPHQKYNLHLVTKTGDLHARKGRVEKN